MIAACRLYELMTIVAQRNQVLKLIGFFVARYAEFSKWANVMHVKLDTQIDLSNAAAVASVAVALTRLSALLSPTWAIVFFVAAFPIEVKYAALSRRYAMRVALPIIATFAGVTAKVAVPLEFHLRGGQFKSLAAFLTHTFYSAITAGRNVIRRVLFLPQAKTRLRTKVRRLPFPFVIAQFANNPYATLVAIEFHVIVLIYQPAGACFRAAVCFIRSAAGKWGATPCTFFVQPRRIAPTFFRAVHLWLVGIGRWVILEILFALRTDCGYFLHCNAFQP